MNRHTDGMDGMDGMDGRADAAGPNGPDGAAFGEGIVTEESGSEDTGAGPLEEELRQAAAVLDPIPPALLQIAVDAYALHDLDARVAELTFDSLVDAVPVRGAGDAPRMLTFSAGEVTVDVEVTARGLMGQVLPPRQARIEVLGGPRPARVLTADDMGRFTADTPPSGPFALRLHTGGDVVVTEWMRA